MNWSFLRRDCQFKFVEHDAQQDVTQAGVDAQLLSGGPPVPTSLLWFVQPDWATINVAAGATVRASGPNPLVLIAAQSITINGGVDLSSHLPATIGGLPVLSQCGAR